MILIMGFPPMIKGKRLSRVRAAAGRAGATARWGAGPRATVCVRLYPADAAEVRRRADAAGCKPADVVARLLCNGDNATIRNVRDAPLRTVARKGVN